MGMTDIVIYDDEIEIDEFDYWVDVKTPLCTQWLKENIGDEGIDTWEEDTILGSKDVVPYGQFINFWFREKSNAVWFYIVWM